MSMTCVAEKRAEVPNCVVCHAVLARIVRSIEYEVGRTDLTVEIAS